MTTKSYTKLGLAGLAVVVFTLGPAVLHGSYSGRWGTPPQQSTAAAAIDEFPRQLGEWVAVADGEPLTPRIQKELGVAGYIHRAYRHPDLERTALVLLMVGQPGPLVRHPPDICYGSRANTLLDEDRVRVPTSGDQPASEFRVLSYEPNTQLLESFQVAYAFSAGGTWSVPRMPRIAFGGEPLLYKAQVQVPEQSEVEGDAEKAMELLLTEFVAAFNEFQRRQRE